MSDYDALMTISEDGRVIEWRRLAEELFGRPTEEAIGRSIGALMCEVGYANGRDLAPLLVKPLLRDTSLVWQVCAAAGPVSRHEDTEVLKAMFVQAPTALHILDDQLRVVGMNSATRELPDTRAGDLIGKRFTEAYEFENPEEELAVAYGVLTSGDPILNRLVRSAGESGLPNRRTYAISHVRLEDGNGDVLGLVASAVDVTENVHAQSRLAILDLVHARVGRRLDLLAVCEELVDAVVPAFAGVAVVEVIEEVVLGEEPPLAPVHRDAPLRRAAFRGRISAHPVGDRRPLPLGTPFSRVLTDLRPRLVSIKEDSAWLAADPARADSISQSHAHSLIVAPLALHGRALGVVSFYRHEQEDPFEEEDLTLASDVCAHAALCIDNARRYTRERIIASTVQRGLLPPRPVAQTTVEISELHVPGPEGGGTWFDAIALPGARTALIVGEVAGQGVTAAITMGLLRTALRSLALLDLGPDELLARLSDTTCDLAAERAARPPGDPLHSEPLTAGCTIAMYDPVDLTCTIARAGLPGPVAIFPDGTSSTLDVSAGPLLTGPGNAPFPASTFHLPAGTTLAMGTAAIADEVLTGPLRQLLVRGSTRPLPDLCDDIAYELEHDHQTGEAVMLLARMKALPAPRVLTLSLPSDTEAAPIARAAARRQTEAWGLDAETAFTNELIVSELVSNAIRYGAPPPATTPHLRPDVDL
ncbi:SpoIIE family protein phosphatase [Streptomyces sp900116325]|uniref:SpoIIE family protein phosphatase n=1 Tax=Streptomyces sp. 900116325 TaxID=3154295 RepID=UPI00332C3924